VAKAKVAVKKSLYVKLTPTSVKDKKNTISSENNQNIRPVTEFENITGHLTSYSITALVIYTENM